MRRTDGCCLRGLCRCLWFPSCSLLVILGAAVSLPTPHGPAHAAFNSFLPASTSFWSGAAGTSPFGLTLRGSRVKAMRGDASRSRGLVMLRRSDKQPNVGEDKWGGGEKEGGGQKDGGGGVGDWKISKNKAPGIVNAASEIRAWMLRAQIERDANDPEMLAIASEFEFAEEEEDLNAIVGSSGGAAGRSVKSAEGESESWFRKEKILDKDPSGAIARVEKLIDQAEAMNMTYIDYVQEYVKKPVVPNGVQLIRPNARTMPEGVLQLVSTPHAYPINTLMPRVPFSTCWYGLFFELEALHRDLEIVGLHCQTGMYWRDTRDVMNVSVYTCEGEISGKEASIQDWQQVGTQEDVRMARVNFTMNSNPTYGTLPFETPVILKAGTTRGFLIHTSHDRGVVLRAKEQGSWEAGEITDGDDDINVRAGLLPCGRGDTPDKVFEAVYSERDAAAFVGVVDYRLP